MNTRDHAVADREREAGRLTFFREVKCGAQTCSTTIPKQFLYCSEECYKRASVAVVAVPEVEEVFDPDYFDDDDGLGEAPL